MNTYGKIFRLTTFGESHGIALGGVIDGVPSDIEIDQEEIQNELNRRRPGQSSIVTNRQESDKVEFLSGLFEGKTTGTPIGFIIRNHNHHSSDYDNLKETFRPSHADYTYQTKYGIRDYRGGGRSSARETASRVVGGAIAKQILKEFGISTFAFTSKVGTIGLPTDFSVCDVDPKTIEANIVRCPDEITAERMICEIEAVKKIGDTIGGVITGVIKGLPVGLGEPVFDKLQAMLAAGMMSINAAKGFEYGMGFNGCSNKGSEMIDHFTTRDGQIGTVTNNSGGIQGGISNGEDIVFRVAFKPVATLLMETEGITLDGRLQKLKVKGRHDPCVLPRAVPIVEAMAAMTILDSLLLGRATGKIL